MVARKRSRAASLTAEGRTHLQEEITYLRERESTITALLRQRREQTDAWELSSFYLAQQEELDRVQRRIRELEAALAAPPEAALPPVANTVTVGSKVTVRNDAGREYTFVIVSPIEADAARGHISTASPIGAGLLGHVAGETVKIKVPARVRSFTILRVE